MPEPITLPAAFAQTVAEGIETLLAHQRDDGSIIVAPPPAATAWQQHCMLALAFCYAGLGPNPEHHKSPRLRQAILKMGEFFQNRFDDEGKFHDQSGGYEVVGADQHMTYVWVETLRLLREMGDDAPFDAWSDKILRACNTLIEHRLRKLVGLRRIISRVLGTSTNHAAFYVSTVYRAGQVLGRKDLCEFVLPIGRALAADIHPDGYFEEHGDLLRSGGPTPSYNYLTTCAIAQLYEWTHEEVFRAALQKSTAFHANFCYPDSSPVDLIDERVRYDPIPRMWGLFGFSHWPVGRGMARRMFETWLAINAKPAATMTVPNATALPQTLCRLAENAMHWHPGPESPVPYAAANHQAALTLPAAIHRRGSWCIGLSAMAATNGEDPAYRENPFALDRQKLFSIWHEKLGLLLDGSNAKDQPENSTFCAPAEYAIDYYPAGGNIKAEGRDLLVHAAYKTFYAQVRVRPLSDSTLQIELRVDPAGNRGPFTAGFTVRRQADHLRGLNGNQHPLAEQSFLLSAQELGGGFVHGALKLTGPAGLRVSWPLSPFNSYTADHKSAPASSLLRVYAELTPERPAVQFELAIL